MNEPYTLITGSTSSIGSEIAKKRSFTDNLLLHGRNKDSLLDLSRQIDTKKDLQVWCYDFKEVNSLSNDFSELLEINQIKINKVIHAAGFLKIMPFRTFSLKDTTEIFNINLFSIIEILRILTRKTHRENLQSVIMLSAFFSKFGDKGNAIYSSSKGALNSLIKGLAVEFPSARFNSIILGAVRTKMTEHLFSGSNEAERFSRYILGTGSTFDVTELVDYLLSENLWMTGQEVYLDGGASIS